MMFAFTGDGVPRLVLGRERLALQGFPARVLDSGAFNRVRPRTKCAKPEFTENIFQAIAADMVATPVMLAIVMATMAALSWSSAPDCDKRRQEWLVKRGLDWMDVPPDASPVEH